MGIRHWTWRRRAFAALAAILAVLVAYAAVPRRADLTAFDPSASARLETAMWRHYYEKQFVALFLDLYRLARAEQGFSPLDSARIAIAAARAARAFQPTASRHEAEAAIPLLVDYFRILARAAPVPVDTELAARTELDWWQARREAVPPQTYGLTIARVATLLYGVDGEDMRAYGITRAQAMAYRDARSAGMTESDWAAIATRLRASYRSLKRALSAPAW